MLIIAQSYGKIKRFYMYLHCYTDYFRNIKKINVQNPVFNTKKYIYYANRCINSR